MAGQHVTIGDEEAGVSLRTYSIVNTPNHNGDIILYVTRKENGRTSLWLHDHVIAGDIIKVNGPFGSFVGDPSVERPVLCLAAGSGLAPIQSLATAAMLRGGFKSPATILFSARSREDLIDQGHFKFLKRKFKNFNFKYTFTRDFHEDAFQGRIPTILPDIYPDLSDFSVYIAGSPQFVEDCTRVSKSLGASEDFIHTESYFSQ